MERVMKWVCLEGDKAKVLIVSDDGMKWTYYRVRPHYTPSPRCRLHSKGWATFQKLHKLGYKLLSC
jgi:hypothetical protein